MTALRCTLLAGTAALAFQTSSAAQRLREISFMTAMPAKTAPVIDGALDDACWKDGVVYSTYYTFAIKSQTPRRIAEPRTECTVMFDAQRLYIGVRNWEPDVKSLRQYRVKDQDPDLWTDDCAELYFDPAAQGESFYRFIVNSLGKCDHLWRMDAANVHHGWVAEGAAAAAKVFEDRWEFELSIPFASLKDVRPPEPGAIWTFDHNRFRYPGGAFDGRVDESRGMVTSPGASFATPNMFGYLYFSDGRRPDAKKILAVVEEKARSEWAIEIDGQAYLHDAFGTHRLDRPVGEVTAERLAADAARDQKYKDLVAQLKAGGNGPFEPLPLPLAGTFEDREPSVYRGFDGFYRQNVRPSRYVTDHFDWRESVGNDRPRILFLTDYGATMRDAVELAQRFPMDIDVYPGDFGDAGVYVDAVSRGTFVDKARQFETYLAHKPDLIVLAGMRKDRIPSCYHYEMLRRIRKEGVGFVDLASDRALAAPALSPDWRADYERRAVRIWNRFREARGLAPQRELEAAVEKRIAAELAPAFGGLRFDPGRGCVPEGGSLALTLSYAPGFAAGDSVELELFAAPYGESRQRDRVQAPVGGKTVELSVGNRDFPTLAAVAEARLIGSDGCVKSKAKRYLYFPNHRRTDYSLISWAGADVAEINRNVKGTLAPLYAPQLVERMGYHSALNGDASILSAFNAYIIPYPCHIRLNPGPSNETCWTTAKALPSRQRDSRRVEQLKTLGVEINPYDPEVRRILAESFENVVTNLVGYGVTAWSLGDECNFSIEAGNGPKDAAPFREFLAGKYGTIGRYNSIRGTDYRSFADVPNPTVKASAEKGDVAAWWDHVQYMEKMYHDTMLFFADIVHRYDPQARVGAEGSVPGDLENQVRGLKFWGPYRNLVNDEFLRVIAPDHLRGIWWGGYFRCLRDGFPVQQWEYLLTGTLNADLWFDMYPGSVMGAFAGDFTFAPYVEEMMPYLVPLRRGIAQLMIRLPFRDDGFAFHYSHASARISEMSEEFPDQNPVLARLIRFCYRTGLAVDFTTPSRLDALRTKKLVFLPSVTVLSDDEVAAFRAFAARGGVLVADAEPGLLDEWMNRRKSPPLKGLWRQFGRNVPDGEVAGLLDAVGIRNPETISGLPPEETVFRIRALPGFRLIGCKTESKYLDRAVEIGLGREGFVYEVDNGFIGRSDRIRLPKIGLPFRLFAVFDEKQEPPVLVLPAEARPGERLVWKTDALRRGSVYRMSVRTPDGRELEHRDDIFAADGGDRAFTFAYNDTPGVWRFVLRDVATGQDAVRTVRVQ